MSEHLDPPADTVRVLACTDCGKRHAVAFITQATECTCGRRLWPLLWDGTAR